MTGVITDTACRRGSGVLEALEAAGYEAYFVGGCVRDELLDGTAPGDIDVTTDARPEDVKRVFAGLGMDTADTGIKHGTVTVLVPDGSGGRFPVEVTTYRSESGYSDSRHPDSVEFVRTLEEDLARRDLTVNAIAMDRRGRITDPFGGRGDLEKGILRTVGDPDARFGEDALRILRTLRFSSVLGFSIEDDTEKAVFRNSASLKTLSPERVFSEFVRLVSGEDAGRVLRRYIDVLGEVFPELAAMKGFQQNNEYHKYDVLEHCIRAMEAVKTTPGNREHMKTAALLHDIGKPLTYSEDETGRGHFYGHAQKGGDIVKDMMSRFRVRGSFAERVETLVRYHDLIFKKDEHLLKKWMRRFTPEVLAEILAVKVADNFATGNMSDALKQKFTEVGWMMDDILESGKCFCLRDLAVCGKDMIRLGVRQGPEVGRMLERILEAVMDGTLANEKEPIMRYASSLI